MILYTISKIVQCHLSFIDKKIRRCKINEEEEEEILMHVPNSLCEPKKNKLIENVVKNISKLCKLAGAQYFKVQVNLSK